MNKEHKDLVYSIIDEIWYGNHYHLEFSQNITLLYGDSATGKTYIREMMEANRDKYNIITFDINWRKEKAVIEKLIKEKSGYLFVFDNADVILTDDLRDLICIDTNNQYLIIGRNPDRLHLLMSAVKKVKYENKTFTLIDI